jgi:hypothetical protein
MRGITRGQPSQRSTQVRSLWKVESPGPSCRGRAGAGGGGVRVISAPGTPGLGWPGVRWPGSASASPVSLLDTM